MLSTEDSCTNSFFLIPGQDNVNVQRLFFSVDHWPIEYIYIYNLQSLSMEDVLIQNNIYTKLATELQMLLFVRSECNLINNIDQ